MDPSQWTTGRLLSTAARLNNNRQNQRLSVCAVTQAGATTLKALSDSGPISQSGLADLVHVQAQSMGKILEKLESRGLVSRVRDSWDGRAVRTCITAEGTAVVRRIERMTEAAAVTATLANEQLRAALATIIDALEPAQSRIS